MEINSIGNYQLAGTESTKQLDTSDSETNDSFSQLLRDSLEKVNSYQQESKQASQELALGKTDNVHQVMIAANKAETSLSLATKVQTKVVDAYKKVMRMRV